MYKNTLTLKIIFSV